jgi:hypothetical protein
LVEDVAWMQEALALGDISVVEDHVSLLLSDFQISLDRKSASYRELATLALQAYVRALQALGRRNAGEVVDRLPRSDLEIVTRALFDQRPKFFSVPRPRVFLVADTPLA